MAPASSPLSSSRTDRAPSGLRDARLTGCRTTSPGQSLEQVGIERKLGSRLTRLTAVGDAGNGCRRRGRRGHGVKAEQASADHHVLGEGHRSVLGDDDGGPAAHLSEPVAELLGVRDGRR